MEEPEEANILYRPTKPPFEAAIASASKIDSDHVAKTSLSSQDEETVESSSYNKKSIPLQTVKKEDGSAAAAATVDDDDVVVDPPRTIQEADKCPVCLQRFASSNSKSYASRCFHAFCFECIHEWSKVRYACPLCKTEFDRIVYDVVSRLEFKEYAMKPRESAPTQDVIPILPDDEATRAPPRSKASWVVRYEKAPLEFRMLVYKESWYVSAYQTSSYVRMTNIELDEEDDTGGNSGGSGTLSSPPSSSSSSSSTAAAAAVAATSSASSSITRVDNLECVAYQPVVGYREASPLFYASNPACVHRLAAFMHRELRALAAIMPYNREFGRLGHEMREHVTQLVLDLVKTEPIDSDAFYALVSHFVRPFKYARHFQHELCAFARSKLSSIEEYDARCVYYKGVEPGDIPRRADTVDFLPMKILPVVLTKYKYTTFPEIPSVLVRLTEFHKQWPINGFQIPHVERRIIARPSRYRHAGIALQPEQTTVIIDEDFNTADEGESPQPQSSGIGNATAAASSTSTVVDEEEVLSDQSSFCEELTPPRAKTPELIDLISSSSSSNTDTDVDETRSVRSLSSDRRSGSPLQRQRSRSSTPRTSKEKSTTTKKKRKSTDESESKRNHKKKKKKSKHSRPDKKTKKKRHKSKSRNRI